MSLVYITHHDENIFDVEREEEKPQDSQITLHSRSKGKAGKSDHEMDTVESEQTGGDSSKIPRCSKKLRDRLSMEYKKHSVVMLDDGVRLLTDAKKAHHRTMGCANVPLEPPCAFLRKNQGVKWRRENLHVCPKGTKMPPLPEVGKKEKKSDMVPNFVLRNIRCARSTNRCPPTPRFVDTPDGSRQNLLNSGLVPQYICRKDFGQVPVYIKKTKDMLSAAHEVCCKEQQRLMELCGGIKVSASTSATKLQQQQSQQLSQQTSSSQMQQKSQTSQQGSKHSLHSQSLTQSQSQAQLQQKSQQSLQKSEEKVPQMPGMRVMDRAERNEILVGLRAHLNEMTKCYQSMSLLIDTENKRQRKGKLESDLRQLEQDILLLETSPIIYVSLY